MFSPGKMGTRRKARIIAFQSLYRYDISRASLQELLNFSWLGEDRLTKYSGEILDFAGMLISGTIEKIEKIDSLIREKLEHWDFNRLAKVDLAILRMSIYCLFYQKDIPGTVTIDEAIDIAKEFGTADSYRFINGLLDGIYQKYKIE